MTLLPRVRRISTNAVSALLFSCALVWIPSACSHDSQAIVCTNKPCDAGLDIRLPANATVPYTITLQVAGSPPWSATCSASGCSTAFFAAGFTPAVVTVNIQWQGGSQSKAFTPTYQAAYPNGPDCDSCLKATIAF